LKKAISIGNFDAVHKGHKKLIVAAREAVGPEGVVEMWSFDPPPVSIINPDVEIHQITTFEQREKLLMESGANIVRKVVPTKEMLSLSPKSFIEGIMSDHKPDFIVEGEGFRFGKNRAGTTGCLVRFERQFDFKFVQVSSFEIELKDKIIRASSSLVRTLLQDGKLDEVYAILGRHYRLGGIVERGDARGRTIGVPTANLGQIQTMLPKEGVYAGYATIQNKKYAASLSIGTKPTFGKNTTAIEVHLIGFDGLVGHYNWPLEVTMTRWLRDQKQFDSIDKLKIAIDKDIEVSTKMIESNI